MLIFSEFETELIPNNRYRFFCENEKLYIFGSAKMY